MQHCSASAPPACSPRTPCSAPPSGPAATAHAPIALKLPAFQPQPANPTPTKASDLSPHASPSAPTGPTPPEPGDIASPTVLSSTEADTQPSSLLFLEARVENKKAAALVDSGASHNFCSQSFVDSLGVSACRQHTPDNVRLADGTVVASSGFLPALKFSLSGKTYVGSFHVLPLQSYQVILGQPWLRAANPSINWAARSVTVTDVSGAARQLRLYTPPAHTHPLLLSALQLKREIRKGADVHLVLLQSQEQADEFANRLASAPVCHPELKGVVIAHADCFPPDLTKLPPFRQPGENCEIPVQPGASPPCLPVRRLSQPELAELQRQLEDLLAKGFIRPSSSPYGAPCFLVGKKDGQKRLVIDYRATNSITVKQSYPLPRIDTLLDALHGAQVFSKLDLRSGYHQIRMEEDSIQRTAFRTHFGSFEFTVMPFGLQGAPGVFQRLANRVLQPFNNKFVLVYMDDILVFSRNMEEHKEHLRQVLSALRDAQLFAKLEKCSFGMPSVEFLGHIISGEGIACDPNKLKAISEWPTPRTVAHLRSFLGLANYYRRFVKDFALLASPLYALLSASAPWSWGDEQQRAFAGIKAALTSAPVVSAPDWDKPFNLVVRTDASGYAIGAVLAQGEGKEERTIAFHSRRLTDAERKYPAHDLETLAVVEALRTWRVYLLGRHFVVRTDNTPTKHLLTKPEPSLRQARWLDFLAEYDFSLEYIPGPTNTVPDALSRRADHAALSAAQATTVLHHLCATSLSQSDAVATTPSGQTLLQAIKVESEHDEQYQSLAREVRGGTRTDLHFEQGVLVHLASGCFYIPDGPLRRSLLHEAHDSPISGHLGRHKMIAKLQKDYYWPSMDRIVRKYIATCPSCQVNKPSNQHPLGLLQPLPIPETPWSSISMDLITSVPTTPRGHDAILVVVDRLTKMFHAIPTRTTVDAPGVARLILDHVFKHHGVPTSIVSDRDPRFTSQFWQSFTSLLGTKLNMSTANHPQTDGQTERANRTLEDMLRAYVSPMHSDWDEHLSAAEFAYNSSKQASTGYTPFELNYGFTPPDPLSLLAGAARIAPNPRRTRKGKPLPTTEASALERIKLISSKVSAAKEALELAQQRQATVANRSRRDGSFKVGDRVLINHAHFRHVPGAPPTAARKFGPRAYGPFTVSKVISPVAYRVNLPVKLSKVYPVFHISQLRPWHDGSKDFPERPRVQPVAPDFIDGEEHYTVEAFVHSEGQGDERVITVKWAGYDSSWNSEEPLTRLRADLDPATFARLLSAYHARVGTPVPEPPPRTRGRRGKKR